VANLRFLKALLTPLEQDRAVEAVARAENSLLNARDALIQRKLNLLNAMGLGGEPDFTLVTPVPTFGDSVSLNTDSLIAIAMQRNPGLKQQHLALDQTFANARLTRNRRFMPSVRVNASYGRGISESSFGAFFDPGSRSSSMSGSLSFSFSFNQLLDFTSTTAQLKQTSAQVEDAVSALRDQTQNLEMSVKLAVNSLNGAYRQLRFAREQVARSKIQVLVANNELLAAAITPFYHQSVMESAAAAERELLAQQLNVLSRTNELDRLLGNLPGGGL
jgi:outer membrane protein TolC